MTTSKSFAFALKFVPPLFLVFEILIIMKGIYNPLPEAENILEKYNNSISMLVGFESKGVLTASETYLIINTKSLASVTTTITLNNDEYTVNEKPGGLVGIILGDILLLSMVWWFWFRPKTHNKQLKKDQ